MSIFFRDFDAHSPVTTGAKWLAALTARVAVAMVYAMPYGTLSPAQVWLLSIFLTGWLATSLIPVTAPLASIINALLLGIGALKSVGRFKEVGTSLAGGLRGAYDAQSDAELVIAGKLLAKGLDDVSLNGIKVVVNEPAFRAVEKAALRHFPIPEWFHTLSEKEIFFRDFDVKEPVTTGAKWFAALVARIGSAFVAALAYTDVSKQLLASAEHIWILVLILAGWFALSIFPATAGVASVVNAILVAIGLASLLDRAAVIGKALVAGLQGAYDARDQAALDEAGKALAPALSGTIVTAIEVLVTHQAFRAAEAASMRRFPVPEWFRSKVQRAAQKRTAPEPQPQPELNQSLPKQQARLEPEQSGEPEPTQSRAETEPQAKREPANKSSKPMERQSRTEREPTRAERMKRTAKGTAVLEGARKTSDTVGSLDATTIGLMLGGTAVGLALTVAGVYLARRKS